MPRVKRQKVNDVTAAEIYKLLDITILSNSIASILSQGGAIMLGQTRDNSKLIVTVYLDGDNDKEYCEDVQQVIEFLGQYQV